MQNGKLGSQKFGTPQPLNRLTHNFVWVVMSVLSPACQNSKQSPQWGRPGTWEKYNSRVVMAALWNMAGHYIFVLRFLPSFFFFFSSPNLSRHRLDVCHSFAHCVYNLCANLGCRSETCCTRIAENTWRKRSPGYVFATKARRVSTVGKTC